jgi:hypothetical protein
LDHKDVLEIIEELKDRDLIVEVKSLNIDESAVKEVEDLNKLFKYI